jgi:hypothetical protein
MENFKCLKVRLGCNSVVELLPSMCKALSLTPNTIEKERNVFESSMMSL